MNEWWQQFFDTDYLHLWEGSEAPGKTKQQAADLWELLALKEGSRILDAPCGYGRISRALAERGAVVLGLDLSHEMLAEAEKRRAGLSTKRLQYRHHDLRQPIAETGFDAALNIFSSLGYGSESDDLAILKNLRRAVRPGGWVFVETMHRDLMLARLLDNPRPSNRLPDGTLVIEEPRFDPVSGRVDTTWYWSGPGGSGQKSASLRVYTATELVRLLEAAGLTLHATVNGCSPKPFVEPGAIIGGRFGVMASRK